MGAEVTNKMRARWAARSLETFTKLTFGNRKPVELHPDDLPGAVSDLICDLLHYARREGMSPDVLIDRAKRDFQAEEWEQEYAASAAAGCTGHFGADGLGHDGPTCPVHESGEVVG